MERPFNFATQPVQKPLTVGQLRKAMSALPDDAEIAVTGAGKTFVVQGTIVCNQDKAIIIRCQEPGS